MLETIIHLLFSAYNYLTLTIGWFLTIWILVGAIIVPLLIIYLLFKHRKNKDKLFEILKPVVLFILFVSLYFLLMYCQRNVF